MSPEENEEESPAVRDEPSEGEQQGGGNSPPELHDLQRRGGMSPDWHERWHGKGSGVGEISIEGQASPLPADTNPLPADTSPLPTNTNRPGSGNYKKPAPPRLFTDVARRLGFDPPNERPRDARPIPPEVDLPKDRPPDFWDPREDGGFDEAIIRPGFPDPEELDIAPFPESEWLEPDSRRWLEPGPPHGYTPDTIAYYLPWHIGGDEHWGIYFRVSRMKRYIERIEREFGRGNMTELLIDQVFWHEMEHFEQELAITALEDLLGQILDPTWRATRQGTSVRLLNRQTGQQDDVEMIQEALATAREVEWAKKLEKDGACPAGYSEFVEWDSRSKSTGYNQFYLCLGDEAKPEARAAFLESVGSVAQPSISRPSPQTANRLFGIRTSSRKMVPVYSVLN